MMKKTVCGLVVSAFLATLSAQATPVVLVHGANFSGESWLLVAKDLHALQVPVLVPNLYSADETVDLHIVSGRLCDEIARAGQPVILIGHSQGGAIITEAAGICPALVKSLVYVAAVIPKSGQGIFDLLSDTDNQNYDSCARLNAKTQDYDLIDINACRRVFMQDASDTEAHAFMQTMVSEPASIGNSKANYRAEVVDPIPRYYIHTANDRIISLDTQKKITAGIGFQGIYTLASSHSPFVHFHAELSQILAEIATKGMRFGATGPMCGRGHDCHPRRPLQ
jgi:pimeloyl-ACP methyl ester carboxylesterase